MKWNWRVCVHFTSYIYVYIPNHPQKSDRNGQPFSVSQSDSSWRSIKFCVNHSSIPHRQDSDSGMMFPIIVIVNYLLRKLCGYLRQSTPPPCLRHHIVNPLTTGNTHAKAKIVGSLGNLKLIAAVGATFWPAAAIALCIFMLLLKSFSFCTSSPWCCCYCCCRCWCCFWHADLVRSRSETTADGDGNANASDDGDEPVNAKRRCHAVWHWVSLEKL